MAKFQLCQGTTSKMIHVFLQNSTSTTGGGITGLVYNTSGLTAYYLLEGASSMTSVSLVTATVGTYSSGGFKEISSTNAPGLYEIGLPNACLTGGNSRVMYI